jgi:hypothetical protein
MCEYAPLGQQPLELERRVADLDVQEDCDRVAQELAQQTAWKKGASGRRSPQPA